MVEEVTGMEETNPGVIEEARQETPVKERVRLFLDEEGERIRQETGPSTKPNHCQSQAGI